jgi:hypothetical protein
VRVLAAAALLGVCVPVPLAVRWVCGVPFPSSEEGSGVPGRLLWEAKLGRRREVREGEGGSGVGGRL